MEPAITIRGIVWTHNPEGEDKEYRTEYKGKTYRIYSDGYSFHFGCEDDPYWGSDLECVRLMDSLKIATRDLLEV